MQDNIKNRTAKGGRPTNEEIAKREPFKPAEVVELPAQQGITCLCCGRAMQPRIIKTEPVRRTIQCTLCGGRMLAIYEAGKPPLIQKL